MTLRFPPHRIACAVLAASLAVPTLHPAFAQSKQPAQDASPYQGEVVEDVVARVNDQVISRSDYARAEQDLENQARQQNWTQQQLFEQKHQLLRDLIDRQLLLSKAKELDITGDTELVKRLDELRKQNNLPTMEALQKAAEDQGVSWEDFKQSERNQIIAQQVIRQEVGQHVNVTPSELQAYYNDHKQDFTQPEQVQVSEILIPTANPDDSTQVAAAQKKADDLESQLKSGGNFATLAKANSGGPTAAQGGELGEFKRGALFPSSKDLEDKVFALQGGQFTEPIRTRQGFAILEVTQHTQAGVQPYKDVEAQVEDAVGMAKMGPAMRDYLTHLREDAYINIKSGYEDAGASPNEMKPIFSAYQPPQPKKKKKVVRARYHQAHPRGRNAAAAAQDTETASAPEPSNVPAGTPSLADVPQGSAPAAAGAAASTSAASSTAAAAPAANGKTRKQQEASAKAAATQKAGKKEKIRFGQAPRETLPTADTKTEDAGANADTSTQVAQNNGSNLKVVGPDGTVAPEQAEAKKTKGRYSKHVSGPKVKKPDPFAPVAPSTEDVASRQEQGKALGLNGDTTKQKKVDDTKTGPKRRMKDRKKDSDQTQTPSQSQQQAPAPAAQPASTPAPAAPAPQN
ncbi:peptidylprolyl isomerase [Silvibacterium sp.]|uniref:peptidylprolyl isomerase n=1 Tax=Silvibacterium sp. TaxID=1964179 RepID=UPI0039E6C47E